MQIQAHLGARGGNGLVTNDEWGEIGISAKVLRYITTCAIEVIAESDFLVVCIQQICAVAGAVQPAINSSLRVQHSAIGIFGTSTAFIAKLLGTPIGPVSLAIFMITKASWLIFYRVPRKPPRSFCELFVPF